jgi:succinate-semialdehyde dehydrogenase/glutarate-semialdehyde dehydrogenase
MRAINPATEETIAEYPEHTPEQIEELLNIAATGFGTWRQTAIESRAESMRKVASLLRARMLDYAELMTREMGKPFTQSEAEIEKCAVCCEHFAEHAARYLADESIASDADRSFVTYEPLGAVLAIMPWNFPFWQVFRFAAPALMAGNVGILKHAPNVPGCAMAIEAVFRDVGFPRGVFTTALVQADAVEGMINSPVVKAVTLTGSTRAGMAVAAQAGRALKKTVLELGGSDPFIVLPDADVEATASAAASARTLNAGQSCIAAKRFIVVGDAEPFSHQLARSMGSLKMGDPLNRETEIGPLARLDLLQNLDDQVRRSIGAGARLLIGGRRVDQKGFFYEPTVLAGVRPGMAAFDEETFGPVAAVISARDEEEAIRLANASPYGLGSSIWTGDVAAAERMASRIEAGSVFINGPVKSDPRLPFGGVKQSGYGRELARHGAREFVNVKTIWIRESESRQPDASVE